MVKGKRIGLAAILAVSASVAAAQEGTPADPAVTPTDEIEVRAQRRLESDQVRDGIRQLSAPLSWSDVVPRFHEAVCPRVVGVDSKVARVIEARISAVADYVGLPKADAKCSPNAFVLILARPPEMFEDLLDKRFGLVGSSDLRDRQVGTIRADLKAGKPAVAWNQIAIRNYDSVTIDDGGAVPVGGQEFGDGVLVTPTTFPSRLRSTTYRAKQRAVVVFDMKQLIDVEAVQLADFASLYLLGWPRREIDYDTLAASTLLTMFRDGPKQSPGEMTDFDRAYLKGVYSLRPNEWFHGLDRRVAAAYDAQCTEEGIACPAVAEPASQVRDSAGK